MMLVRAYVQFCTSERACVTEPSNINNGTVQGYGSVEISVSFAKFCGTRLRANGNMSS